MSYQNRVKTQISQLIDCIERGADILCIQEQPYELDESVQDRARREFLEEIMHNYDYAQIAQINKNEFGQKQERKKIFVEIMHEFGYVQIGQLKNWDMGTWVKASLANQFKPVEPSSELSNFLSTSLLRGYAIQSDSALIINVHSMELVGGELAYRRKTHINLLIPLRELAINYAKSRSPALEVAIPGDFSLPMFDDASKQKLISAGYKLKIVKGQEDQESVDKKYEASYNSNTQTIQPQLTAPQQLGTDSPTHSSSNPSWFFRLISSEEESRLPNPISKYTSKKGNS